MKRLFYDNDNGNGNNNNNIFFVIAFGAISPKNNNNNIFFCNVILKKLINNLKRYIN